MRLHRRLALRALSVAVTGAARGALFALDVAHDLTPGVRMTRRRRLPRSLFAGVLGAEVATWWAVSPSLLPRPWWVTAANVAICQGVGHVVATGLSFSVSRTFDRFGRRPHYLITVASMQLTHATLAAITTAAIALSLRRQPEQARLVDLGGRRGARHALIGGVVGTAGYGALLLLGDAAQVSVDRLGARLSRYMPIWVSWPLAAGLVGYLAALLSDRVLVRRTLHTLSRNAAELNRSVFPGTMMPWEPERSGSPWSYEAWSSVGAQGRAVLALGPRARDITDVTGLAEVHEPIRIFAGLVPGRSLAASARRVLAEMDRTGAFRRDTIVIQTSAGTGWITDWSVCAYEFLTGGNCATVSMQYSYLPSAVSYVMDRDSPILASRELIEAVLGRIDQMPADDRPKVYVAGESLGGYGIAASFDDLDDLLTRTDGAVFSGSPRFTRLVRELTAARDAGSPERLPVVDGGRHVRFVAHPDHLRRNHSGVNYPHRWRHPRAVIAQHASDPIVWWNLRLVWQRPDWLTEPGSRGVRAPRGQRLDVVHGMRWVPFITAWQVGLDQLTSLHVPGGHGHNYHDEMLWYWDAVLGDHAAVRMTDEIASRAREFIVTDSVRR